MNKKNTINEDATYTDIAEKIFNDTKDNFDKMKLESDEMISVIIPSDVACVTLSNKRAYFRGDYLGSGKEKKGEALNLETIESVRLTKKTRKTKRSKLMFEKILIICILLGYLFLQVKYTASVEETNNLDRRYETLSNHDPNGPLIGYTFIDLMQYIIKRDSGEDFVRNEYFEERIERTEKHAEELRIMESQLYKAKESMTTIQVSKVICIIGFCIVCLIIIIKYLVSLEKYMVLEFQCPDKRRLGIEIRDNSFYDKVKNIILVTKSAVQPKANISAVPHTSQEKYNDKIGRLKELTKLFEQGVVSEEEFSKLKTEIINNQ